MKFILGSKKVFDDFLDGIKTDEQIGVIAHNDLDGVASAVLIDRILEKRRQKVNHKIFTSYSLGMFQKMIPELKKKNISKIFLLDVGADNADFEGFEKLRREFDVLFIDHHLVNPKLKNHKNIIKTPAADCVMISIYRLGKRYLKGWEWLAAATIISEISYKTRNNYLFVKRIYPKIVDKKSIHESKPGKISGRMSAAITYYSKDIEKVFDAIIRKDMKSLEKASKVIRKEITELIEKVKKKAEYYKNKNLYFFIAKPRFDITSPVSTIISFQNQNAIFVIGIEKEKTIEFSARNQSQRENMAELMKKGINGLKNATAGGHVPAAGATIKKKDLERFKKNILE